MGKPRSKRELDEAIRLLTEEAERDKLHPVDRRFTEYALDAVRWAFGEDGTTTGDLIDTLRSEN